MDGGRTAVLTKMGSDSLLPAYLAGRRRDRVHVVPAQQPRPLDRVGGRRARAARVEAAGPEHGRGLVARRARSRSTLSLRGQLRDLSDQPGRRPRPGAPHAATRPSTARPPSRRTARRSRSCRTGRARRRSSSCRRPAAAPSASPSRASTTRRRAGARAPTSRRSPSRGATSAACSTSSSSTSRRGRIDRLTQGQGLEPGPDLVARRAAARLRLEPRAASSSRTPRPTTRCRSGRAAPRPRRGARPRGASRSGAKRGLRLT